MLDECGTLIATKVLTVGTSPKLQIVPQEGRKTVRGQIASVFYKNIG